MAKKVKDTFNIQGLSRKDAGLMAALTCPPGYLWVESDLAAAENRLIAHYSQDKRYVYANLTGLKQPPFKDGNVLMIGDGYLMLQSVSGIGSDELWDDFENGVYDGTPFTEQWVKDSEPVKGRHKKKRNINKTLSLACGYGMMARKMQKQLYEQYGIQKTLEECETIYNTYWELFSGVKEAIEHQVKLFQRRGYVLTPFNFIVHPKHERAAFNGFIQSQVSSIMIMKTDMVRERAPWAPFITTIHDADMYYCPEDRLDEFRQVIKDVMNEINDFLGWTVRMEAGFNYGKTWKELK